MEYINPTVKSTGQKQPGLALSHVTYFLPNTDVDFQAAANVTVAFLSVERFLNAWNP